MSHDVTYQKQSSTFFSTNYFRCSEKIYKIKMGRCEKECLIFLMQYQNCPSAFPSLPTIIDAIEANKRTVIKALSNLEEKLKFIKKTKVKGLSNTYVILYDNLESAYQASVKNASSSKKTRCKNATRVGANMPLPPGAKMHPYNNESIIINYNNDKESPSSPVKTEETAEKAVIKEKAAYATSKEICDLMKSRIPNRQDNKPNYVHFSKFKDIQITKQEADEITDYAREKNIWLSVNDFSTPRATKSTIDNLLRLTHGTPLPQLREIKKDEATFKRMSPAEAEIAFEKIRQELSRK